MRQSLPRLVNLFNHDFCPGANRYVYWLKQPIGWFVLAATAALTIGVSVAPQALVVCAAITAVVVLGVAWPWIGLRGISCSLSFDRHRATEGSPVGVRITVANRWPWPLWGLMVERGFFVSAVDPADASPAVSLARIPGWSRSTFRWDFEPQRRGRYPTEVPRLASGFPFGIWHGHREIAVENELVVWPRMAALTSIPPIHGRSLAVAGTESRQAGDEGDMLGVRPYRSGDALRHVHWAQTAKHDRLVVCERQATGRRRVQLILDADADAHRNGSAAESLEEVIRVGASIGRQLHAHHANIELRIGRRTVVAEPGNQGLKRMLDALATWSRAAEDSSGASSGPEIDARSLLVVVTTDSVASRWKRTLLRHRDAQLIILAFAADGKGRGEIGAPCQEQETPELAAKDSSLVLDGRDDVLARLVRGWERICHDGWSRS
jgi:uncharacterized protein (DUF58 family)